MLERIEACIFDLDGTIIDSMWAYPVIDRRFFESKGKEFPSDIKTHLKGKCFSDACKVFKEVYGIEGTVEQIHQEWIQTGIDIFSHEVQLKKGAFDFIHRLKKEGNVKLAIATCNSIEMAQAVVKAHGIDVFDEIKSACQVEHAKPAPDVYLATAETLGVKPEKCIVFEDTPDGIIAGKRAGMKVCAMYDDYSKNKDDEKKKLSDFFAQSFNDIFAGTYLKNEEMNWIKYKVKYRQLNQVTQYNSLITQQNIKKINCSNFELLL